LNWAVGIKADSNYPIHPERGWGELGTDYRDEDVKAAQTTFHTNKIFSDTTFISPLQKSHSTNCKTCESKIED